MYIHTYIYIYVYIYTLTYLCHLTCCNKTSPCHLRSGTPLLETAAQAGGVLTAAAPVFTAPDPATVAVSQADGAGGGGQSGERGGKGGVGVRTIPECGRWTM